MYRIVCGLTALTMIYAGIVAAPAAAAADEDAGFQRQVYVTNRGITWAGELGPHVVVRFAIGAAGEVVQLGEPVAAGNGSRGIVFTPDARAAYVVAQDDHVIYPYRVNDDGALTDLAAPVDSGGVAPFSIAITPGGRTLYVANLGSGTVSVFGLDGSRVPVMLGEPVVTGSPNPRSVAVSPDGRSLFVAHGVPADDRDDVLVVYPIRADGTLGPARATVPIGATGMGLAITPDGKFLYVACALAQTVYGFRIGPNGELTAVPHSPWPAATTPEGLAITPDGSRLFVTSVGTQPEVSPDDDGLWTFDIGDDGDLTLVGRRSSAATGPGVATTPDGQHLFVSNFFANTVSAFEVDTLGELAGSPTPSLGFAPSFNSVALPPNQGPSASFTVDSDGELATFDATESADRDGRIARYDWEFGDGTTLPDGGPRPSHVYGHPGAFRVKLVVTDNEGCSTALIYTGRTAMCTGSVAGRATQLVRFAAG